MEAIPTNINEVDKEIMEEFEKMENGKVYKLLYAGIKMNREKLQELTRWIKFMIPTVVSLVGIFAAFLAL